MEHLGVRYCILIDCGMRDTFQSERVRPKLRMVHESTQPVVVLIDDDILVQLSWKMAAKNSGVLLHAFSDPEEFIAQLALYDRKTPIYLDSHLGAGVRGETVAEQLYQAGFECIYLETGYEADQFGPMPWLKGIVGKDPPF